MKVIPTMKCLLYSDIMMMLMYDDVIYWSDGEIVLCQVSIVMCDDSEECWWKREIAILVLLCYYDWQW